MGKSAKWQQDCNFANVGGIFGKFRQMATERNVLDLGDRLWARGDRGGLCGRSVTSGLVLGDNLGERGGL